MEGEGARCFPATGLPSNAFGNNRIDGYGTFGVSASPTRFQTKGDATVSKPPLVEQVRPRPRSSTRTPHPQRQDQPALQATRMKEAMPALRFCERRITDEGYASTGHSISFGCRQAARSMQEELRGRGLVRGGRVLQITRLTPLCGGLHAQNALLLARGLRQRIR
jgi:hypothetical protein